MVVRLDLEDRGEAVADVDGAGVLARPLDDARARRRQRLQMDARALVAAVLGPHHREDAELGQVRLAAEDLDDAVVLVAREPVASRTASSESSGRRHALRLLARHGALPPARSRQPCDYRLEHHQAVGAAERRLAGALGMRHQADDVARSLQRPAMLRTDPFGLASGVTSPAAST